MLRADYIPAEDNASDSNYMEERNEAEHVVAVTMANNNSHVLPFTFREKISESNNAEDC